MLSKKYSIEISDPGAVKVFFEYFDSTSQAVSVIEKRPFIPSHNEDCQYFQRGNLGDNDSAWLGFSSIEEFKHICLCGLEMSDDIKSIVRYAGSPKTSLDKKLSEKIHSVSGFSVDVPEYLSSNPECMIDVKRLKVRSRIVKIGLECSVDWTIPVDRYILAGKALSRTIVSLERAGFRVRLLALCSIFSNDKPSIATIAVKIKGENEPFNYRRLLMPLLSTSFFRGLCFNWVSTLPNFSPGRGLGLPLKHALKDYEYDPKVKEIVSKGTGDKDYFIFGLLNIVELMDEMDTNTTSDFLKVKILDLSLMEK